MGLALKNNNKYLFGLSFAFLFGLSYQSFLFNEDSSESNYKMSNWITLKGVNSITNTLVVKLNSENAALILKEKIENGKNLKVSIPVCNFLTPGKSPFFVFGTKDKFLIQPKRAPRGCFEINTEIPLMEKSGAFYIYFYSSEIGNIDLMDRKNYFIKFYGKDVPLSFFHKVNLKNRLTFSEESRNYQKYSKGGLAIGNPRIE